MKRVLRALKTQHIDIDLYRVTRVGDTAYAGPFGAAIPPLTFSWLMRANTSARTLLWAH